MKTIILLIVIFASKQVFSCDRTFPHSFSCQESAFVGKEFPLFEVRPAIFERVWVVNQFTPSPRLGSASPFQTLGHPNSKHRTCGVINSNRTRVGNMMLDSSQVSIANFRGRTFKSNGGVRKEGQFSVIFTSARTKEAFRCRAFERVSSPHLTCQYFHNNVFIGYLGMLASLPNCR